VLFLAQAILFGGLTWVFGVASGFEKYTPLFALLHTIGGLYFGAGMTIYLRWQRTHSGGITETNPISQAIKTGRLPDDAAPAVWVPLLERRRVTLRRTRTLLPLETALIVALDVYLLVQKLPPLWLWAGSVVLFTAGSVAAFEQARRRIPVIQKLQQQLIQVNTLTLPPAE
jgi:hypothetical protein